MTQLYMLTAPSGKRYIGVTKKPLSYRVNEHRHAKTAMGRAMRKYNEQIETVVLVVGEENYIYDLEKRAIEVFGTMAPHGYNLREGGHGGRHTEESKRKIGAANRGKIVSVETRKRIGMASRGRVPSQETRKKLSTALKRRHAEGRGYVPGQNGEAHPSLGKIHTVETRKKMSEAWTRRKAKGV